MEKQVISYRENILLTPYMIRKINDHQEQSTCFLVGGTSLLIQCGEILLNKMHHILGIVSADIAIDEWANKNSIPYVNPQEDWKTFLSQYSFDYLFSIVNSLKLPSEILALPRKRAINYHDSPLPKYAGINATSWALMNREKTYAVTWHQMTDQFDEGDILKQFPVEIAQNDTAFTLNAKCYEAAIHSFNELINELSEERINPKTQNLEERTYFSRSKTQKAGFIFSWNRCALEIDAFVRALDFGSYRNPLGTAKFLLENELIIVSKLEVLGSLSEFPPGTITAIEPTFIKVCTASYEVALHQVLTIDGQNLSIPELVARFRLHKGYQFRDIAPELAKDIETLDSLISKYETFWVDRLTTLQPITVPYAKLTASHSTPPGSGEVKIVLPPNIINFLKERYPECNSGDLVLTAIVAYLARLGGISCFDIGFKDINLRQFSKAENFFASYIPCRIDINIEQNFEEVFATIRQQVELTKRCLTYTRDIVLRYPGLKNAISGQSQVLFPVIVERVHNLEEREKQPSNTLRLVIPKDGLEYCCSYNLEIFDNSSIEKMLRQFDTFLQKIISHLKEIATNPKQPISELPLLTEQELSQLLVEWNNTEIEYPQDKCIHQLFEEQVEHTPDAVAVVFEGEQLTYRELNAKANQLAHCLQTLGVKPEVLVGICVERSLEMIVGILGILKAGGAYIPIDPAYPSERIEYMFDDSHLAVLLTQEKLIASLPKHQAQVICLDSDWEKISTESVFSPLNNVTPENLAYVIYTSGSTGKPKGVTVLHRAVNRLVINTNYIQFQPSDVVAFASNFSFDAATFEIWGALLNGAKLAIITKDVALSPDEFAAQIHSQGITVLFLTTALFNLLAREVPSAFRSVRHLLFGGEAVEPKWVKEVLKKGSPQRLLHVYGPTENTTFTSWYLVEDVSEEATTIPIGRPIANTEVYLLDTQLQPVPIGVYGEVYIGGDGLARGYLNRPDLTEEKFIPSPFNNKAGSRLYKTGDLARYLPDGNIEFLGRIDNQVKIRGFRIELGEVEAAISQHPAIRETVVIVRDFATNDKQLVAYIVPCQEQASAISDLRHFLKQQLPDYMIPSAFVVLEILPLTPNGKVDRKSLPPPDINSLIQKRDFVAPGTPTEKLVASIWSKVLKVEKVGINDNFFELGGHSLLATQLIVQVKEALGVELTLSKFFEAPTVANFSSYIEAIFWAKKSLATSNITINNIEEEEVEF